MEGKPVRFAMEQAKIMNGKVDMFATVAVKSTKTKSLIGCRNYEFFTQFVINTYQHEKDNSVFGILVGSTDAAPNLSCTRL